MAVQQLDKIEYMLKSKDIPLIDFSLLKETETAVITPNESYRLQINHVFTENSRLFPKNLSNPSDPMVLLNWIIKRKAPKNRQFINEIMSSIDDGRNPLKYIDVTYGLSLNDAFWISNNTQQTWDACNLYKHPFDERLAYVAFTGCSHKITGLITSPELTSSGALKKCWRRNGSQIYLMKGDDFFPRTDGRSQATIEFYAAQVAAAMGFSHVDYDLAEFKHRNGKREIVCTCDLFTTEDIGFCSAAAFFEKKGIYPQEEELSNIMVQRRLAEVFGKKEYADVMLFDAVICNTDRHLGNFGYLVDNNTGEFIKPAPIFDNGLSLLYNAGNSDLEDVERYLDGPGSSGLFLSFDLAAELFVERRHIDALRKLTGFTFKKHPRYNIADTTLKRMAQCVQIRARKILEIYCLKEKHHSH